jgi:glycosyltransferase involved in cell wall biosynthesis
MRICIVSQEYPPETGGGGIGTQAHLKAQGLSARGHHVEVVSASWENPRSEYDGKALIHRIKPSDFGIQATDDSAQWMTYSLCVAQKLAEMEAEKNFDIIQFPEYVGEGFFHQTNNFQYRKARYSVQLHGPLGMFAEHMGWPEKNSTAHRVGCFMEKMVIHHADGILASSHNTARFCASHYDYPLEKINVIHSGIDIDRFSPQSREVDEAFPRILFVGNLVGTKGFNLLVDTVCRMSKRYPRIKLRTMGKGEDSVVRAAQKRAAEAGVEGCIEFLRYVPHSELPKHFAWCDFFAGPSVYEPGPGNVYLEAMA